MDDRYLLIERSPLKTDCHPEIARQLMEETRTRSVSYRYRGPQLLSRAKLSDSGREIMGPPGPGSGAHRHKLSQGVEFVTVMRDRVFKTGLGVRRISAPYLFALQNVRRPFFSDVLSFFPPLPFFSPLSVTASSRG